MRNYPFKITVLGLTLGFTSHCVELQAGEIDIVVTDVKGAPVEDAVVSATLVTATGMAELDEQGRGSSANRQPLVTVSQENKQFTPLVTAVGAGTAISFPHRDNILHNVYSFSKPKKNCPINLFQLPPIGLF